METLGLYVPVTEPSVNDLLDQIERRGGIRGAVAYTYPMYAPPSRRTRRQPEFHPIDPEEWEPSICTCHKCPECDAMYRWH